MKESITTCPIEEAMRMLGGRWRLLIVHFLLSGPKRFNQLRREIPGISQRMLTLDLRALEEANLISRSVFPTVPVTVEYALTVEGKQLIPVCEVMWNFGKWLKDKKDSQT
ncbi:winged helix-turn-helix transcriptional regulator [Kluyvera sp. 142486]|uniref:winged helix-turn-helix transcriptional regulator n=1 Tax=Kluyvera sp. 142486 TaxID=3390050 RepID=UPI00397FE380